MLQLDEDGSPCPGNATNIWCEVRRVFAIFERSTGELKAGTRTEPNRAVPTGAVDGRLAVGRTRGLLPRRDSRAGLAPSRRCVRAGWSAALEGDFLPRRSCSARSCPDAGRAPPRRAGDRSRGAERLRMARVTRRRGRVCIARYRKSPRNMADLSVRAPRAGGLAPDASERAAGRAENAAPRDPDPRKIKSGFAKCRYPLPKDSTTPPLSTTRAASASSWTSATGRATTSCARGCSSFATSPIAVR